MVLGSQPAALLHLVSFGQAVGRDPKPPPKLASLLAHETTLEAGDTRRVPPRVLC